MCFVQQTRIICGTTDHNRHILGLGQSLAPQGHKFRRPGLVSTSEANDIIGPALVSTSEANDIYSKQRCDRAAVRGFLSGMFHLVEFTRPA